jgi:hypothetical protein
MFLSLFSFAIKRAGHCCRPGDNTEQAERLRPLTAGILFIICDFYKNRHSEGRICLVVVNKIA